MSARLRRVLYLSAGLACLPGLAAAQADGLTHDPFARPALIPRPAPPPASAAPVPIVKAPVPDPVWKPELRAIMVAGAKSMVNVDGVLVGIGEQFNGYRLVEVQDETAVFANDKKRVTLLLRGMERLRQPRQEERETKERRDLPPTPDDRGTIERRDAPPSQDVRGAAQARDASSKPENK